MSDANKALVKRYYDAVMGDFSGLDSIVAADFVDHHMPAGTPPGPTGVKQFFQGVLGAVFSDMRIEHEAMLAEGDKVVCTFALRARHTADFGDIPAKGFEILCKAISTFRIANGKLAEAWEIYDSGDLAKQMLGQA